MTPEDLQNTFMLTHINLKRDLGTLDDLPYELANTIANVYWRQFEQGHPSSPILPAEESILREEEYLGAKRAIAEFRVMLSKGTDANLVLYTVDFLLDWLRHRIPDIGNKRPIWRRIQRLKYPSRDRPNLVRSLKLYGNQ
jgi:hypothetical protein